MLDPYEHPTWNSHAVGGVWKCLYKIGDGKLIWCQYDHIELFGKKEADGKLYDETRRPPALNSANKAHMYVFKRVEPGSKDDVWSPSDIEEHASKYEGSARGEPEGSRGAIQRHGPAGGTAADELAGTWEVIERRSFGHRSGEGVGNLWVFEKGKLLVRTPDDPVGWLARYDQYEIIAPRYPGPVRANLRVDMKAQMEDIRRAMERRRKAGMAGAATAAESGFPCPEGKGG